MIRHVAVFRWKAGTTSEEVRDLEGALSGLPAAIPQIAGYKFGADLGMTDGAADFAVVADFATVGDWRTYSQHPAHVKAIEDFIVPIRESRIALQYEIGD